MGSLVVSADKLIGIDDLITDTIAKDATEQRKVSIRAQARIVSSNVFPAICCIIKTNIVVKFINIGLFCMKH